MAAGTGAYAMAAAATFITIVVLLALPPVEAYFERRTGFTTRNHDK